MRSHNIKHITFLLPLDRSDKFGFKSKIIYTVKSGQHYEMKNIICSSSLDNLRYECSIECDGGILSFDRITHKLKIDDIRTYENILTPFKINDDHTPEEIALNNKSAVMHASPDYGWLNTQIQKNVKNHTHRWIQEVPCSMNH